MNFDKTVSLGCGLDYGIIFGNEEIVFIKSGRGGTHLGEDEKYLKMATKLYKNRGFTVICASNPVAIDFSYSLDLSVIREVAGELGARTPRLTLIGSSNGAYQNLLLANEIPAIKILCINMPLMINFQRASRILSHATDSEKIFVFGSRDPSFPYIPFLEAAKIPRLSVKRIEGADHTFSGMTDSFISLAELIE